MSRQHPLVSTIEKNVVGEGFQMIESKVAPTRLYAFLLRLRPLQRGTLMPFSGELVHGAWMRWLRDAAPDVATKLHEGNRRRFFTCSSLISPLVEQQRELEWGGAYLQLEPTRIYTVRITLLQGELFPLCYESLLRHMGRSMAARRPFFQIGQQIFSLEEMVLEGDPWARYDELEAMIERTRSVRMSQSYPLTLEFASLATHNRSNNKNRGYGPHHARLPLPIYVFPGLARRWEDVAPSELWHLVQRSRLEQYIEDDGIIIADYELFSRRIRFTTHVQPGFVGICKYQLRGPDEPVTTEAPLTVRQQFHLLGQLAFYTGVGYKTSMGMGRTRML